MYQYTQPPHTCWVQDSFSSKVCSWENFVSMDVTFRESEPFYGDQTDLSVLFKDLDHLSCNGHEGESSGVGTVFGQQPTLVQQQPIVGAGAVSVQQQHIVGAIPAQQSEQHR